MPYNIIECDTATENTFNIFTNFFEEIKFVSNFLKRLIFSSSVHHSKCTLMLETGDKKERKGAILKL